MNTPKILVVDDEEPLLEVMREILEYENYNVLTASGGREAFSIVQSKKVELIITDIRMPLGDGVELLLEVRKRNKKFPPVIVLTGYSSHNTASLMEKGADFVMQKPVDPSFLLDRISKFEVATENVF